MEELYRWICSVAGYFLLMTMLEQLLPDKKYVKYIRLFGGMVLILLIFRPLTSGLRVEDTIVRYYETFVFQNEANDLKRELLGVEQQRLSKIIATYEEAAREHVIRMADALGMETMTCEVDICKDQKEEAFGKIQKVTMQVRENRSDKKKEESQSTEMGVSEKVVIGEPEPAREVSGTNIVGQKQLEAIRGLQNHIASYYELEEAYVEIQIVGWER